MTIKRRRVEGVLSANPTTTQFPPLGLGAKYATLRQIRAKNWASSAKAAPGTDTGVKIKITDNNGDIVYLDASDRDYATAEVTLSPTSDDTATGLGVIPVDATGAAATAGAGAPIVMESPVRVVIVGATTATDYMTVDILVEV